MFGDLVPEGINLPSARAAMTGGLTAEWQRTLSDVAESGSYYGRKFLKTL
jgi:hypothetical protein